MVHGLACSAKRYAGSRSREGRDVENMTASIPRGQAGGGDRRGGEG